MRSFTLIYGPVSGHIYRYPSSLQLRINQEAVKLQWIQISHVYKQLVRLPTLSMMSEHIGRRTNVVYHLALTLLSNVCTCVCVRMCVHVCVGKSERLCPSFSTCLFSVCNLNAGPSEWNVYIWQYYMIQYVFKSQDVISRCLDQRQEWSARVWRWNSPAFSISLYTAGMFLFHIKL